MSVNAREEEYEYVELFGKPEDVARVSDGLERWWKLQ